MLQKFLILSLCVATITASGDFSILNTPKALAFKGSEELSAEHVGQVLYAALGNDVSGIEWSGMIVKDPFNMPEGLVVVSVQGLSSLGLSNAKTYPLEGKIGTDEFAIVAEQFNDNHEAVCNLNFNNFEQARNAYSICFTNSEVPAMPETKNLKYENAEDKQFLQTLGYIKAAGSQLTANKKLLINLSVKSLIKVHGEKSEAIDEAKKLLTTTLNELNVEAKKVSENILVAAVSSQGVASRKKRETSADTDNFNLAEYYSEDYPVIFNIILWFMVTFGLALLAICYAIGSMDPGRDSIIYRMTSTRMKKDN